MNIDNFNIGDMFKHKEEYIYKEEGFGIITHIVKNLEVECTICFFDWYSASGNITRRVISKTSMFLPFIDIVE